MPDIDWCKERKCLDEQYERRRECPHERKPIRRTDQQIDQRQRPGEEDKYFEQVRDRTAAERVTANRQERALQGESDQDGEEIKARPAENAFAQRRHRVCDGHKKTESRAKEKLAFHRERPA